MKKLKFNPRGFLLPSIMAISLLTGGMLLNWYQQSIQQRYQSQAFLESQILFQELNGAAIQAVSFLQIQPPESFESTFYLTSQHFGAGYSSWTGETQKAGNDLLLNLKTSEKYGEIQFQLLLRNRDNASAEDYLQADGILILEN